MDERIKFVGRNNIPGYFYCTVKSGLAAKALFIPQPKYIGIFLRTSESKFLPHILNAQATVLVQLVVDTTTPQGNVLLRALGECIGGHY